MEWSRQVDFTLSASLHQGALVASYPYDSCDTQARSACAEGTPEREGHTKAGQGGERHTQLWRGMSCYVWLQQRVPGGGDHPLSRCHLVLSAGPGAVMSH